MVAVEAIRHFLGTRRGQWLVAITLFAGMSAAVVLTAVEQPADRTLAAVAGVFGVLVSAVALAVAAPDVAHDAWRQVAIIAAGGVLVLVLAGLVGTGLGLLLRSSVVAFLATIVLPFREMPDAGEPSAVERYAFHRADR